jgi:spore coat protein A, manganese oxidase
LAVLLVAAHGQGYIAERLSQPRIEMTDKTRRPLGVRINRKGHGEPVSEKVRLGSTEKWRVINATDDSHPMHLHRVQFQILERQTCDLPALRISKSEVSGVNPRVLLRMKRDGKTSRPWAGEALTILDHFDGYTGRYLYHCHMLEHKDDEMMRPCEVF